MFLRFASSKVVSGVSLAVAAGAAATYYSTAIPSPMQAESKKPKLVYFDTAGRAFAIRAALRHANVAFEDVRISFPQLVQARGPSGANNKVPLGQLPILELPSGEVVCQSVPILRWAAKQSDLYPKKIDDALICDEVIESITEVRSKLPESKDENERKRLREDYVQNTLPKYMDYLTRRLEQRGGPFFLGKQLTMADLVLARVVDGFVEKRFDHISRESLEKWPAILQHYDVTRVHPVYVNEMRAEEAYQQSQKGKSASH